jgi:NitT/TauT family transport system permease protein
MSRAAAVDRKLVAAPSLPSRWRSAGYQFLGVILAVALWHLGTSQLSNEQFRQGFSPASTFRALIGFVNSPPFLGHVLPSLTRFGIGLGIAIGIGIPLGILIGYFRTLNLLTNAVFQFGRMTSPLAWMPIAIIVFGIGNKPVCFLIAVAAVWPIMLNTANGVRNVDPIWLRVVEMLGASQWEVLRRAVIPAIIPDMLVGLRISIGISWIILVPAEMLGVSSGLGYYILDTRDRFNYSELLAVVLIVGFLGFLSDTLVRLFQRRFSWREEAASVVA